MSGYFRNTILVYFTGRVIILLVLLSSYAISQTKTNLEVLFSLTDSLADKVADEIPGKDEGIVVKLNLGETYSVFANNIRSGLIKEGIKIFPVPPDGQNLPELNLNLTDAEVEYEESERDGWFGDYYVPRTIFIEGNYLNSSSLNGLQKFHIVCRKKRKSST